MSMLWNSSRKRVQLLLVVIGIIVIGCPITWTRLQFEAATGRKRRLGKTGGNRV